MATYTSSLNPNFYSDKAAQVGEMGWNLLALKQKREEEERQRALGRAQVAVDAVGQGASPNDPAVQQALDGLRQHDKATADALESMVKAMGAPKPEAPGKSAFDRLVALSEQGRQGAMQEGVGVLKPEVYGERRQKAAQAPTGRYVDQAMSKLPIGERLAAQAYAKQQKIDLPTERVDESKLPAMLRALPPEERERAAKISEGLELSKYQKRMEQHREKSRTLEEARLQLARSKEARLSESATKALEREVTKAKKEWKESLQKTIAGSNLDARRDWQMQLRAAGPNALAEELPPKPPAILASQARQITNKMDELVEAGVLEPIEAETLVFEDLLPEITRYMTEEGLSADEAVRTVLSGLE